MEIKHNKEVKTSKDAWMNLQTNILKKEVVTYQASYPIEKKEIHKSNQISLTKKHCETSNEKKKN